MQERWLAYKFNYNPIFFSWKTFNHCQLQVFLLSESRQQSQPLLFFIKTTKKKNYQLPLFPENSLQLAAFSSPRKPPAISTPLLEKPIKNDQLFLFPKETFRDFQLQELISTRPRTYIMSYQRTLRGPRQLRDNMYEMADKLREAQRLHSQAATQYLMWAATNGERHEAVKCLQQVEDCSNTEAFIAHHDTSPIMTAISCGHVDIVLDIVVRTGWEITRTMIARARAVRRHDKAKELDELRAVQEHNSKEGRLPGTWIRPFGLGWEI